ncbi:LysR family transcriptional regulator [Sphingobium sp.]|uniref:LysR family transcriptional regulator n=1 Tax=Sphingobium TaxID=165695 RepID=UPI001A1F37E5|nr:LysR family transcriptional regulator [Sphingobium sp.]MBJ7375699.1 LysR family transcriptional regulator [Sphingobium sp.]
MFPFTIRQLELFSSLCRTASFRDTADAFRISQPSVSSQISALEFQLGFKLFIRERGRPPKLTTDGGLFRKDVESFLEMGRQLAQRRTSKLKAAPIRIKAYVGPVLFHRHIKQKLAGFYDQHPDLNLQIVHDQARNQVIQDLRKSRFDVATFYHWERLEAPGIEIVGAAPAGIFVHRDLAAAAPTPENISRLPFVLPPKDSFEELAVLSWLGSYDIVPENVVGRAVDYDITASLVSQGKCACYMNEAAFNPEVLSDLRLIFPMGSWFCHFFATPRLDQHIAARLRTFMIDCLAQR